MKTLTPTALLGFAAILLSGCSSRAATPAAGPPLPPAVAVAAVASARPQFVSSLPGELRPYQDVDVQARVDGFVTRVLVDRGSAVRAGQLLAVMEAPDLVARRAAAEQRLNSAAAQRQQAQAALQRDQGTLERLQGAATAMAGAVAGNDLSIAAQTVASDQAEVAARAASESASERDLKSIQATEDYLRVTAPFAGEIVRRGVSPGSLAGPAKPALFQLQQLDPLRLVVDVPENEAAAIASGMRLSFTVIAQPGTQFPAVVTRISHSLRPSTRTMPVELDVANPDRQLAPGMYARVAWQTQRAYATLFVPATAILTTTQDSFVERVRNHRIEWVSIQQGFSLGDQAEVFGNLHAGDTVVRQANDELHPGVEVRATRRP